MALKVTVHLNGNDESDLLLAIDEVRKGLEAGCAFGSDRNDTGSYQWEMQGERATDGSENDRCPTCGADEIAGCYCGVSR